MAPSNRHYLLTMGSFPVGWISLFDRVSRIDSVGHEFIVTAAGFAGCSSAPGFHEISYDSYCVRVSLDFRGGVAHRSKNVLSAFEIGVRGLVSPGCVTTLSCDGSLRIEWIGDLPFKEKC